MTAPAALADIAAQIAGVQARIAAITTPTTTTSSPATTPTTSAATFASTLSARTATPTTAATGGTGDAVVSDAMNYLGVPYVWGGESTSGMDCSGLVQKTFGDLGITLPRTAAEQQQVGTPVASLAAAQPGDLLFFGSPAYHVAIYAGDGKLIESPEPGKTVHVTDVYQTPTSIRRVAGPAGVSGAAAPTGVSPAVSAYAAQFAAAEQRFGLPSGMLAAVAQQESGGNARAVSPAGAQGLMQLMPSTAAGMGVDPFDPSQAIPAAARILSRNLDEFGGSVPLALAAYNAGAGAVERYGGIPPYAETQNYVKRITAMMAAGA
jgi:cell wall-associated NlpC family hydrolase